MPGAPGRGDHDGERLHARNVASSAACVSVQRPSVPGAAGAWHRVTRGRSGPARRCSRRAARSASSIDSIDSRIVAPSKAQISGCVSSCSHSNPPAASSSCGQPWRQCLVRVRAVVLRVEERRLHHVDGALDRRLHVLRVGVVPRDDAVEAVVEVDVRIDRVVRDPVAELAQARDRALALARGEVVEDRARHQEPRRPGALRRLDLGHRQRAVEREVDVVAQDQVARLRARGRSRPSGSRRPWPPAAARGSASARSRTSSSARAPSGRTRRPRAPRSSRPRRRRARTTRAARGCATGRSRRSTSAPRATRPASSRGRSHRASRGRARRVVARCARARRAPAAARAARGSARRTRTPRRASPPRARARSGRRARSAPAARVCGHGAAAPPTGRRRSGGSAARARASRPCRSRSRARRRRHRRGVARSAAASQSRRGSSVIDDDHSSHVSAIAS